MQKQIQYGQLTLILPSNKTYTFGPSSSSSSRTKPFNVNSSNRTRPRTYASAAKYDYTSSSSSSTYRETTTTTTPGTGGTVSGVSTPLTSVDPASPREGGKGRLGLDISEIQTHTQAEQDQREEEEGEPTPVTVRVKSSTFFLRLLLSGDLGFAEAYMAGECDISYTREDGGVEGQFGRGEEDEPRGQRLDEGYYGEGVVDGLKGEREGEELLELFKVGLHGRSYLK